MDNILDRWKIAQEEERKLHDVHDIDTGWLNYRDTYRQYFEKLDISKNQTGKTILEIGPADFPALEFCKGYEHGYIIEPLPSKILKQLIRNKPITLFDCPAEYAEIPEVDEVWLLNVLQHTINPGLIIDKAKKAAKVIRFFEPINDTIDICHLHSFDMDFFRSFFGTENVKHHAASKGILRNFHEHECAYGVWKK